jgi:hypothetical protein
MKQRTGTCLLLHNQSGGRVENVLRGVGVLEIKHRVQPPGKVIKRSRDSLAVQPVVLDEAQNRGLIGHRVIDVVLLGVRRDQAEADADHIRNVPGHALWSHPQECQFQFRIGPFQ